MYTINIKTTATPENNNEKTPKGSWPFPGNCKDVLLFFVLNYCPLFHRPLTEPRGELRSHFWQVKRVLKHILVYFSNVWSMLSVYRIY